jgi:hypothetical protein
MATERHVPAVVTDHSPALLTAVIVELHVVQVSALCKNTVGVSVSRVIVDAVENAIVECEIPFRGSAGP